MMGLLMGISAGPRAAAGGGGGGGLPVTANLVLHLAASAITGLNDGDPITTWPDASGLGNDAVQTSESLKPTYKAAIVNGLPVVRFAGQQLLEHPIIDTVAAFTYYILWARASDTNHRVFITTSGLYPYLQFGTAWHIGDASAAVGMTPGTFYLRTGQMVPGVDGARRWSDGSAGGTSAGAASGSGHYDFKYLGFPGYEGILGDVAEIAIFSAEHDATDRAAVEDYLATKYGITLA